MSACVCATRAQSSANSRPLTSTVLTFVFAWSRRMSNGQHCDTRFSKFCIVVHAISGESRNFEKRGGRKPMYQPSCHSSQMHLMNSTCFIRKKGDTIETTILCRIPLSEKFRHFLQKFSEAVCTTERQLRRNGKKTFLCFSFYFSYISVVFQLYGQLNMDRAAVLYQVATLR